MAGLFQKARFFYSRGEAFPGACGEVRSLEMLESLPERKRIEKERENLL